MDEVYRVQCTFVDGLSSGSNAILCGVRMTMQQRLPRDEEMAEGNLRCGWCRTL